MHGRKPGPSRSPRTSPAGGRAGSSAVASRPRRLWRHQETRPSSTSAAPTAPQRGPAPGLRAAPARVGGAGVRGAGVRGAGVAAVRTAAEEQARASSWAGRGQAVGPRPRCARAALLGPRPPAGASPGSPRPAPPAGGRRGSGPPGRPLDPPRPQSPAPRSRGPLTPGPPATGAPRRTRSAPGEPWEAELQSGGSPGPGAGPERGWGCGRGLSRLRANRKGPGRGLGRRAWVPAPGRHRWRQTPGGAGGLTWRDWR